ncbi:MAG: HAMP domain-containing histidine kinase, partial [Promethearchaeota archaeon]
DLARIDAKEFQMNMEFHDPIILIEESIEDMKFFFEQRNIKIHKSFLKNIKLKVDDFKIKQVLTNILSNAIKNSPDGSTIYIRMAKNESHLMISVKDEGIGITKDEMKNLFQRFKKIERNGLDYIKNKQGTGLGLYIAKQIIRKHKGEIYAESEGRNKGATFKVKLPLP